MLINLEEKKEGGEEEMQEIKSERKKEKNRRKRKERREASRTHLFKHNIQPCRCPLSGPQGACQASEGRESAK